MGRFGSRAMRRRPSSIWTAGSTSRSPELVLEDCRARHHVGYLVLLRNGLRGPWSLRQPRPTSPASRTGDGVRVRSPRASGAERRARQLAPRRQAGRPARRARRAPGRDGLRAGADPRAATSSGSTSRAVRTRGLSLPLLKRIGVAFIAGPDFYPWAGGGRARPGWRTTSPPRQLREAVGSWRGFCSRRLR